MDPEDACQDMLNGNHLLRHVNGTSAVPADQCGKQTYIKQGKGYGGLKGISTGFAGRIFKMLQHC